jgi:hypothetical protein
LPCFNKIKSEDASFVGGSSSKKELKGVEASNGAPNNPIGKLFGHPNL